ncbi:metallophosphoesterase [Sphingomonas sp. LT1P40]|uniref:metallophosphoesterase n=1 Tax=Alteristakelama amylovorans TaxID=3096166 RepID=UPI002FCA6579
MKRALIALVPLLFAAAALLYHNAVVDPVVRHGNVGFASWPKGAPPLRVAFVTDLHVQGPDMPPARLRRIIAQVNAQRPDVILLAGDYRGDRLLTTHRYSDPQIIAPLAGLRAPLGIFAVIGNHDHSGGTASIVHAMRAAGIRMLWNEPARVGPLVIVGNDYRRAAPADIAAMNRRTPHGTPLVIFGHIPDLGPVLPTRFRLVLAGHTHCGQVVLPVIGAVSTGSRYGERFRCGMVREPSQTTIVSAGLGTSIMPARLGAPPDFWMLTMGPLASGKSPR